MLLALVFLKNSRRRKKILLPGCGNEKPNPAKVASDLPQCTGWVHCGNLKLKNIIHPADSDVVNLSWTPTGFHFSRKHTKKGILNWKKKCFFIILTNKVRRAASTPDPSSPPPAFLHIQPPSPTHTLPLPSKHRPLRTSWIRTPTCRYFTPFCVSSLVPSPGSCRMTGSFKNKSVMEAKVCRMNNCWLSEAINKDK